MIAGNGGGKPVIDTVKTRTWFSSEHTSDAKTQSVTNTEETSHTRSESRSRTEGASVGDEITFELVYDHTVQPETLMALPEEQMLAPHVVAGAPAARDSRMVALVIDPGVVGTDAVASVAPHEIPAYEPPAPAVSSHVPDYVRLPPAALDPADPANAGLAGDGAAVLTAGQRRRPCRRLRAIARPTRKIATRPSGYVLWQLLTDAQMTPPSRATPRPTVMNVWPVTILSSRRRAFPAVGALALAGDPAAAGRRPRGSRAGLVNRDDDLIRDAGGDGRHDRSAVLPLGRVKDDAEAVAADQRPLAVVPAQQRGGVGVANRDRLPGRPGEGGALSRDRQRGRVPGRRLVDLPAGDGRRRVDDTRPIRPWLAGTSYGPASSIESHSDWAALATSAGLTSAASRIESAADRVGPPLRTARSLPLEHRDRSGRRLVPLLGPTPVGRQLLLLRAGRGQRLEGRQEHVRGHRHVLGQHVGGEPGVDVIGVDFLGRSPPRRR